MSFLRSFQAHVPGKWVLAGEHTVLRGGVAVALPHPQFSLDLQFQPQVWQGLSVVPASLESLVAGWVDRFEKRAHSEGRSFHRPRGTLLLESTIPLGAGLGSSAALCVAMSRWVQEELRLEESEIFEFARTLEDDFHGKSSGMDVAVAQHGVPLRYNREAGAEPLGLEFLPRFTFHDTGLRASTKDCVARVQTLQETDRVHALALDQQMKGAALESLECLGAYSSLKGAGESTARVLQRLASAMEQAQGCFRHWGLVPAELEAQARELRSQGALAVKVTGAGAGGFLVALHSDSP